MTQSQLLAMFYIIGNAVCIIICLLLFLKNIKNKQTTSQWFKKILLFLITYFIADIVWAPCFFGLIPNPTVNNYVIRICRMVYYSMANIIALAWLYYIEVQLDSPIIKNRRKLILAQMPIFASIVLDVVLCALLDPASRSVSGYITAFAIVFIPFIYIVLAEIHIIYARIHLKDNSLKASYNSFILWPIIILVVAVAQIIIPELPIFCFGAVCETLTIYIYNQDSLIFTDSLTEINNRNMLYKFINETHFKDNCYVVMIDLDKFKEINDTHGHLEGDKSLRYVAEKLKLVVEQKKYFLARYGGDEFVLILKEVTEAEVIETITRVKEELKNSVEALGYPVSASFGYYEINNESTFAEAVQKADEYLYKNKK